MATANEERVEKVFKGMSDENAQWIIQEDTLRALLKDAEYSEAEIDAIVQEGRSAGGWLKIW